MDTPGIGVAFFAGFLSFISPCVLPLIPAYIGYLGGRATSRFSMELAAVGPGGTAAVTQKNRLGVLLHGLFFVGGFTIFFVSFGLLANLGFQALQATYDIKVVLYQVGGLLVIFFGLHIMGVTGWTLRMLLTRVAWQRMGNVGGAIRRVLERIQSVLYSDTRRQINPRNRYGYAGSSLMGIVFAAGWTPCIGPIYGSILTLASTRGTLTSASVLLVAYSLGLGVPFLLTAAALDQMRGLLRRLQRWMRVIELVSGAFLIFMGVLLLTNQLALISQFGTGLGDVEFNLEACLADGVLRGKVPVGDLGDCLSLGPNYKERKKLDAATPAPPVTPGWLILLPDGRALYAR